MSRNRLPTMVKTSQASYAFAVQFWTSEGKRCRRFFKSRKEAVVGFNKLNKVIHKEGAFRGDRYDLLMCEAYQCLLARMSGLFGRV